MARTTKRIAFDTPALRRFRRAVNYGKANAEAQSSIAKRIGIGQQHVSSILLGKSRPAAHVRDAIEREWPEVHAADWMTAEERAIARGHRSRRAA